MAVSSRVKLVAFDLGGVLVNVDRKVDGAFFEGCDFENFTLGQLSSASYFSRVSNRLKQPLEDVEYRFRKMVTTIQGYESIIRALQIPFTFWSNINMCHFEHLLAESTLLLEYFSSARALSFEINTKKPAPFFFELALQRAQVKPEDIIFLDDCPKNVKAARQLNIDAHQCMCARDIWRILGQRNLMSIPKGLSLIA